MHAARESQFKKITFSPKLRFLTKYYRCEIAHINSYAQIIINYVSSSIFSQNKEHVLAGMQILQTTIKVNKETSHFQACNVKKCNNKSFVKNMSYSWLDEFLVNRSTLSNLKHRIQGRSRKSTFN